MYVLMSKTREILNVLNLACKMEYLLRVNDASEPDWAVRSPWRNLGGMRARFTMGKVLLGSACEAGTF